MDTVLRLYCGSCSVHCISVNRAQVRLWPHCHGRLSDIFHVTTEPHRIHLWLHYYVRNIYGIFPQ